MTEKDLLESSADINELEYELDNSDEQFLSALNTHIKARATSGRQLRSQRSKASSKSGKSRNANGAVTDDMLEQLIDGLEKEAFFVHGLRQMRDSTMDGMLCCVCNDHDADKGDVLVMCDGCNMAVHQHCYGVYELPIATWLCTRCQARETACVCVLCGGRYGGMKPTTDGRWAHVLCALWFPEVSFKDSYLRDPIDGIDKIQADKWNKVCGERHLSAFI